MAIETSYVPSEIPGAPRPQYKVEGDTPWRCFTNRADAEAREAELANKEETTR